MDSGGQLEDIRRRVVIGLHPQPDSAARILSELNQEGRNDDYDSSHHNGHAGKQHGVDNDSDHSRSPFLRPRYTNAYLGAMVASVADTVFFAPWPLRNMYATRRVNG